MTYDWRHDAACLGHDPDAWFPIGTEGPAKVQAAAAKAVCATCPVREPCYQAGLDHGRGTGVWGGVWFDLRSRVPARA